MPKFKINPPLKEGKVYYVSFFEDMVEDYAKDDTGQTALWKGDHWIDEYQVNKPGTSWKFWIEKGEQLMNIYKVWKPGCVSIIVEANTTFEAANKECPAMFCFKETNDISVYSNIKGETVKVMLVEKKQITFTCQEVEDKVRHLLPISSVGARKAVHNRRYKIAIGCIQEDIAMYENVIDKMKEAIDFISKLKSEY